LWISQPKITQLFLKQKLISQTNTRKTVNKGSASVCLVFVLVCASPATQTQQENNTQSKTEKKSYQQETNHSTDRGVPNN
jgi:hypothetical protein